MAKDLLEDSISIACADVSLSYYFADTNEMVLLTNITRLWKI